MADVPLVSVRDLGCAISGQIVLSSISFSVDEGKIVGIIGPNGAGKTTLMECLAGLRSHEGFVEVQGKSVPFRTRHRFFFYQPDQVLPYPDHGVYSTLCFFNSVLGAGKGRLDEVIDGLKLDPVLTKAAKELSRGYQKRLLIAIGLMSSAPILLLDEPFEGLDIKQTKEVVAILQNEKAKGKTLLLSIHQIADAARIADEFLLVCQGKILGAGSLEYLQKQTGLSQGNLEDVFFALT